MYPLEKWTPNFIKSFKKAGVIAANSGTSFIGTEHMIYAFLCTPECEAYKVLVAEGVTCERYGSFFNHTGNRVPLFKATSFAYTVFHFCIGTYAIARGRLSIQLLLMLQASDKSIESRSIRPSQHS